MMTDEIFSSGVRDAGDLAGVERAQEEARHELASERRDS
jgi:hypothetical protein